MEDLGGFEVDLTELTFCNCATSHADTFGIRAILAETVNFQFQGAWLTDLSSALRKGAQLKHAEG